MRSTRFRKEMNDAENDGGAKAIDSLLNYETVKVRLFYRASAARKFKYSFSTLFLALSLSFDTSTSTMKTTRPRDTTLRWHGIRKRHIALHSGVALHYESSLSLGGPNSALILHCVPCFALQSASLSLLNFGQSAILSVGLTGLMLLSAHQIQTGKMPSEEGCASS